MRRKTHERRVGRRTKENRNTGGGEEWSGEEDVEHKVVLAHDEKFNESEAKWTA